MFSLQQLAKKNCSPSKLLKNEIKMRVDFLSQTESILIRNKPDELSKYNFFRENR